MICGLGVSEEGDVVHTALRDRSGQRLVAVRVAKEALCELPSDAMICEFLAVLGLGHRHAVAGAVGRDLLPLGIRVVPERPAQLVAARGSERLSLDLFGLVRVHAVGLLRFHEPARTVSASPCAVDVTVAIIV